MRVTWYILIGIFIGWLTIGVVSSESYLQSDIDKIILLLGRIADNTEVLR